MASCLGFTQHFILAQGQHHPQHSIVQSFLVGDEHEMRYKDYSQHCSEHDIWRNRRPWFLVGLRLILIFWKARRVVNRLSCDIHPSR